MNLDNLRKSPNKKKSFYTLKGIKSSTVKSYHEHGYIWSCNHKRTEKVLSFRRNSGQIIGINDLDGKGIEVVSSCLII